MPDYPVSLSQPAAEKLFGRFSWRGNGQSCITILGRWIEENITTVYIRELDGAARSRNIQRQGAVAPQRRGADPSRVG